MTDDMGGASQVHGQMNAPVRSNRFNVTLEMPGGTVEGWQEVDLPATNTEVVNYREGNMKEYDHNLWGRTDYDNLTMVRGAKREEKMLWDWREKVNQGKLNEARKKITVEIFDSKGFEGGQSIMKFEFIDAWPISYTPPTLDAMAQGGSSAMASEELEIVFERYYRRT